MDNRYQAVFLIPCGARTTLQEYGWEIESETRLDEDVLTLLVKKLGLQEGTSWADVDVWENASAKFSTGRDSASALQFIYGQLRGIVPDTIRNMLKAAGFSQVEVFVPSELPNWSENPQHNCPTS